jgi:hypothetical protein
MTKPPDFIADFDSASAMVRATSAFLRGEDFPALGQSQAMKPFAAAANVLPRRLREKVFILGGVTETVPPRKVGGIDAEELSEWLLGSYPDRTYPAVAIGSSSGAGTHLHTAMGIPWLPQTFLIPVGQKVHPDDPSEAMELGREPGRALLEANPDLQLHHMHDANQDRLMVRALTYFRVKRRTLGPGYERFLAERLPPGGTILLMECRRTWNTTRIADRHVFQHGALGGATEEEFHEGSERVADYLERYDSPVRRWHGPEPDTVSPEAEWGFADELRDDVERVARERGYRVRRLIFEEPESLSPMVADLYRWWYARRRIPANRLMISSFVVLEAYWALRTGSVPFWMKFNMRPSLEAAERFLQAREPFDDINLMLFQHGVEAVGLPSVDEWRGLFRHARRHGGFLGTEPDEFPYDFAQFARYHDAVQRIPARYPLPSPLSMEELDTFLDQADAYEGVTWKSDIRTA